LRDLGMFRGAVQALVFSHDGSGLAIKAGGEVHLRDTATGAAVAGQGEASQPPGPARAVALPGGDFVLAGDDGVLRLGRGDEEVVSCYAGHAGGVMTLAAVPGGKAFVSGGADGVMWLWDRDRPTWRIEPLVVQGPQLPKLIDGEAFKGPNTA